MKHRTVSRPARLRLLLVLLPAALGVLLPASPAWAHAQLLGSSPAADSVMAKAPRTLTLSFDGPVKQRYTTVVVTGPDKASYSDGAPSVVNGDVRQKLRPLPTGRIQVTWQTVAADGAPLQGRYTFTSTDTATAASARPSSSLTAGTSPPTARTSPSTAPQASPPVRSVARAGSGGTVDWPWWAAAGALVATSVALLAFGVLRSARSASRSDRRRR
ncbi:copper resistance protein CopC [Streptomyces sp. NPDC014983]|uniref:copper resistance CopC family protein n=1 Tax=Streptomyces sp. NPDC014983 TaxID=3364933 RepID=UPI0036FDAFDB